jgi:hypothetical protein
VPLNSFERDHELRRVHCTRFRPEGSARDRACASSPDPLTTGSEDRIHKPLVDFTFWSTCPRAEVSAVPESVRKQESREIMGGPAAARWEPEFGDDAARGRGAQSADHRLCDQRRSRQAR